MESGAGDASKRLPKRSDNRRRYNATDETIFSMSSRAVSLEQAMIRNLQLEDQLEKESEGLPVDETLKRMLSTKSVISTTSSFAQRHQEAAGAEVIFREIGTGSIGKVFEHPGTICAYKLPVSGQIDKMWNNYTMHKRIEISFQSLPYMEGQVEIPRCFWYATPETDAFWAHNLDRFPDTPEFPCQPRHILCMERIFPLPQPVRHALIEKYCPPQGIAMVKESQTNKDCLVRPCLGRMKYGGGERFFSLRNFTLHANQIRDLGLPSSDFYIGMAHALAVLHWHTKVDGKDIEFVLGSSPVEDQAVRADISLNNLLTLKPQTSTYEQTTHSKGDFTKRITSLWVLDFDDCGNITMDQSGVDKAVKAFLETNFYCPKPNTGDEYTERLWKAFSEKHLNFSQVILAMHPASSNLTLLPPQFVSKICQNTAPRQQQTTRPTQRTGGSVRGGWGNSSRRRTDDRTSGSWRR